MAAVTASTAESTTMSLARRARRGLTVKFSLAFIGLVSLVLLASGAVSMWLSYDEAKSAAVRVQQEKATAAAERIEAFILGIEQQIGWTTQAQWSTAPLEQRRYDLIRLLRQVPAITELVELDSTGHEQLKVSRLAMDLVGSGADYSTDPRFTQAVSNRVWFGPVYLRKETEPYMTIAAAHLGRNPEVTVAEVNLKFIWDVVSALHLGKGGYAYVVDDHGRLLAHPDISLVLRDTNLSRLEQVADALAAVQTGARSSRVGVATGPEGGSVLSAYAPISRLAWLVFVELPLGEAMAPVYASLAQTGGALGLGLLLAATAGAMLARRMVVPIRRLEAGAERLGVGELDHRIAIHTGDEIENLAERFNRMAEQLQDSYATLELKVQARTRDLAEALEHQTATSALLHVISRSAADLEPVFSTLLENAVRICQARCGILFLYDDRGFEACALCNVPEAFAEYLRHRGRQGADPRLGLGRLATTRRPVHIDDLADEEIYRAGEPFRIATVELLRARTWLGVPVLKGETLLGAIVIYREEVQPFSQKQIDLVATFANQAVIAIENARLLSELRQRTAELARSVEELTATGDVLKLISRSTFDLEPVLDALVERAARLCDAEMGNIWRLDGNLFRLAGWYGYEAEFRQFLMEHPPPVGSGTLVGRTVKEGRVVQIIEPLKDPQYLWKEAVQRGGLKTMLGVPLMREGVPIGALALHRKEVRAFADKQIELVVTFADQAVIAIENTRLLTELRQRTGDLARSVEELTATSDVLKIISRSSVDLQTVLDTLVETAARLCHADQAFMFRRRADRYHVVSSLGAPEEFQQYLLQHPFEGGRGTATGRAVAEGRTIHIADVLADPEYTYHEGQALARFRTNVSVPLLREDTLTGVFTLCRNQVDPFAEKEIELLTTFADQAVIAIENARLFDELRERSAELARSVEDLRALSVVGQAVTSSLDLKKVLETIVARAVELAGADGGAIFRYGKNRREFRLWHAAGFDDALLARLRDFAVHEAQTELGRAARENATIAIADLTQMSSAPLRDIAVAAGFRSALVVPLVRGERILGALVVQRRAPRAFTGSTVDILQTFASQSVLAIQNARLFREIEEKGQQLAIASQHKSQFLANMSHELRTPLNAILGYAELLADGIYGELPKKAHGVLERVQSNGQHLLGLINDVLDLSKIEAGQLTLVMEDYAMPAVIHSVVSATESLAKAKSLSLSAVVPRDLPMASGDERRLTQVLLNLVGNAIKFTDTGTIGITVALADSRFDIAINDTGPGIARVDQERIFEEFQQVDSSSTRRKGGTGLGLAISRRIVEMHGGSITVESELGRGSTFHVVVPVRAKPAQEVA